MSIVKVTNKGGWEKTNAFLTRSQTRPYSQVLDAFGQEGVAALSSATPMDSGETAASWRYEIEQTPTGVSIAWFNDAMAGTAPLAVLIQYGHGTRNGGYVQGRDFINPAIQPVFDAITKRALEVLTQG